MFWKVALGGSTGENHVNDMNIYIDESIHEEYGFMLLAFVACSDNPQDALSAILNNFGVDEFHACKKMKNNESMQKLRSKMRNYINSNCGWGVFILPNSYRYNLISEIEYLLTALSNSFSKEELNIHFDNGIIKDSEADSLCSISNIRTIENCDSVEEKGIQLADLVAALCGVRLREEISGNKKILEYGSDSGFDPPIKANLGYELWASLRYSMLRDSDAKGSEPSYMMVFDTLDQGCFISRYCSNELESKSKKVFGEIYLGCIH